MMTHDVEGEAGIDFCDELMDIDDSFGIKSAFQLIPEGREEQWRRTAAQLRARGFEVNLHDLNHDGRLFADKDAFLQPRQAHQRLRAGIRLRRVPLRRDVPRAGLVRAPSSSAYDMSVPNAAHLEPQRGGCCTVMPYFVGNILELPLTTIQDYSLFHILDDYSTTLWKEQIRLISEHHGLISVIAHPDYLIGQREREVYVELASASCRAPRARRLVDRVARRDQSVVAKPPADDADPSPAMDGESKARTATVREWPTPRLKTIVSSTSRTAHQMSAHGCPDRRRPVGDPALDRTAGAASRRVDLSLTGLAERVAADLRLRTIRRDDVNGFDARERDGRVPREGLDVAPAGVAAVLGSLRSARGQFGRVV